MAPFFVAVHFRPVLVWFYCAWLGVVLLYNRHLFILIDLQRFCPLLAPLCWFPAGIGGRLSAVIFHISRENAPNDAFLQKAVLVSL